MKFEVSMSTLTGILLVALLGCSEEVERAGLPGVAAVPQTETPSLVDSIQDGPEVDEAADGSLEAVPTDFEVRPGNYGVTTEIDEFFFAPFGFPGFLPVSGTCNLDDDPYGACL